MLSLSPSAGGQAVNHSTAWDTSARFETARPSHGYFLPFSNLVQRQGAAGQHGAYQVHHNNWLSVAAERRPTQRLAVR